MRPTPPTRPRTRLVLVTLLAVASLIVLVVLRPDFGGVVWNRGADVALVAAWFVAFATSAWLVFATGACVLALAIDRPALARRIAPTLPRGIRTLVEVAIAGSFVVLPAVSALPAYAAGPPPTTAVVLADQPVVRAPAAPTPLPVPTAPAARVAPPSATTDHVVVRAGDNLWLIARTALLRTSPTAPSERDIARYWLTVIRANRATLRSGDPSLIFAGEIVTLPPPSAVS